MRKYNSRVLVFICALLLSNCTQVRDDISASELGNKYIEASNALDFDRIKELIADSIQYAEGEYVVANSIETYYVFFQWDSVFNPKYKILEERELNDNLIEFTISKKCSRIKFLHDSATVYKLHVLTENEVVSKLRIVENVTFNLAKWQKRRDTLVNYIKEMHPELIGFEYDITLKGARNYLKAIEYFELGN